MKKLHYERSGDNYKLKDPYKLVALRFAKTTSKNLSRFKNYGVNIREINISRGESAYRVSIKSTKIKDFELAHVEEGIGTKNIIADEMSKIFGKTYYYNVALDNAASIFNDLSTSGAFPLSFMLHIGAFPNEWFLEKEKIESLLKGTAFACNLAGASWGGGESSTMRDVIVEGRALLSGSATGLIIPSSKALSEEKLKIGDRIILFESSGIHTNGVTLLRRELLKKLPQGYKTLISNGSTYGEALLTPSIIYSKLVEELVNKAEVHYAVHITGHGWRKIMRAKGEFSYILDFIPKPQPIFDLIKKYSNSSNKDMYETYNMGAGFAIFVPKSEVEKVLNIAKIHKIKAWDAGVVEKGDKKVLIRPLNIEFGEKDLVIR